MLAGIAFALLAAGVAQAAPVAGAQTGEPRALTEQQEAVVNAFLRHDRYLRWATRGDCRCDATLTAKPRTIPDYEPFVATGDFNGDGQTDIAVLLFDRDPYMFAPGVLAIFNGPLAANKPPAFVRGDVPLENRGLFLSTDAPHHLMFGRFDASGCTYRPFDRGYREDCSSR